MTGAQKARVTARAVFDLAEGLRMEVLQAEGAVQLLLVQRGPKGERVVRGNIFADALTAGELRHDLADEIERGLALTAAATVSVPVSLWDVRLAFAGPVLSRMVVTITGSVGRPLVLAEARIDRETPARLRRIADHLEGLA